MFPRALPPLAALILIGALWLATNGSAGSPTAAGEQSGAPERRSGSTAERGSSSERRGGRSAILRLRNSRYGKVIFEKRSGLVAYLFTKDGKNRSKCHGECADAWPPIKTKGKPRAGAGLRAKDVGSIKRGGGTRMVTYKGRPLYFYAHDGPGEILCNDVFQFGGDWFVIKKNGKAP